MDAILSLGVTQLVDAVVDSKPRIGHDEIGPVDVKRLDRHQSRDLLLLAACYDQSTAETIKGRWNRLRRKLRFYTFSAKWPFLLGLVITLAAIGLVATKAYWTWLEHPWIYLIVIAGWLPWLVRAWKRFWMANAVRRNVRIGKRETNQLRQILMNFTAAELSGQPLPSKARTDDRYELLAKFQGILETLGYHGMIVLVDRVDEPHLINGATDQMRALLMADARQQISKTPKYRLQALVANRAGPSH